MTFPFRSYFAATTPALTAMVAPLIPARPSHGLLAVLRWKWAAGVMALHAHRRLASSPWERIVAWCDTAVLPLAMMIHPAWSIGVALRVRWVRRRAYLLAAGSGRVGRGLLVLGAFWLKGQCEWAMGARSSRPSFRELETETFSDLHDTAHWLRMADAERFALRFPPPTGPYLN